MAKTTLTPRDIELLDDLFGNSKLFKIWRTQAGFSPLDEILDLGQYLAGLGPAGNGQGGQTITVPLIQGFAGWVTPPKTTESDDPVTDEFDSGVLADGWTALHLISATPPQRGIGGGITTGYARTSLGQRPGWLLVQPDDDGTLSGYTKASESDMTESALYYTRFSVDSNAQTPSSADSSALVVCHTNNGTIDPTNALSVVVGRLTDDNTWRVAFTRNVNGSSATVYSTNLAGFAQPFNQMGLQYVSTIDTWIAMVGNDEGGWKILGTYSNAAFRPDRLALTCVATSQQNPIFGWDFVRREPGAFVVK